MKSARKIPDAKVRTKKSTQDDLPSSTNVDEKAKKSVYSVSTPRNFIPKSSTADIYAKKKPALATRKMATTPRSNESPMKNLLKSSPSNISLVSPKSSKFKSSKKDLGLKTTPTLHSASKSTPRRLSLSNVTVNSPVAKRRLNLELDKDNSVNGSDMKEVSSSKHHLKETLPNRQRTKTRTLEDDEVKILTPDAIDNKAAMQELSRKLTAQPKAFYIDLEEKPRASNLIAKQNTKSSEEDEISYEDDFESYESDFESYHSEPQSDETSTRSEDTSREDDVQMHKPNDGDESEDLNSKEVKDDEKMLDSGNFDLRDCQRSASRKPAVMDFILEGTEDTTNDKKTSLTDEGFQEMSSSSVVSSMRIVHTEVLERPLFIDFTKSKENKRKRKILARLQQRAKDILSMITLHEMSYSLFEMKPIPYDLYMATFGRKNYTQVAVQTFEDGITEEVQTDDVLFENKWTQFPVEFSTNDIISKENTVKRSLTKDETLICKFDYLIKQDLDSTNDIVSEEYKLNPLKIFLEQKAGSGSDKMLPEEIYKAKLKNNDFNNNKLRKFLKKSERRLATILSINAGDVNTLNLTRKSKLPFSKGYLSISTKNITEDKNIVLKYTKMTGICTSETKENLILTYHIKPSNNKTTTKYFICLWDTSVATSEPIKILKATDNVLIGRYRGNTNGIFAAALEDRTLQVWDLTEEPTWFNNIANLSDVKATDLVKVDTSQMSEVEIDREWNLKNSQIGYDEKPQNMMQVSAYTSSAINMNSKDSVDSIVALEFLGEQRKTNQDGGRKIVGQICTLQRLGILFIWSITQEKSNMHDIGKAYWSKIKLEKIHILNLSEHLDAPISDTGNNFNLNAAKRRRANRKHERFERRKDLIRPRSALLKNFDRPTSVSSPRKNLLTSKTFNSWDNGILCNHLKVLRLNTTDNYLMANENGDVFCCKRNLTDFKVDRLRVASHKASITRLEVAHNNLPYFLAATNSGTINLCSILDAKVLLTLDCRNGPPITTVKCQADHKGRFIASVPEQSPAEADVASRYNCNLSIRCLTWSPTNPFCIIAVLATGAVVTWELTRSDINPRSVDECAAVETAASRSSSLALMTKEGEVQIHRLLSENDDRSSIDLFNKYVALL